MSASSRGRSNREKGRKFESQVARMLTHASGVLWRRSKGGEEQPFGDVTPQAVVGEPWSRMWCEAKAHSDVHPGHLLKPNRKLLGWWETCVEQAAAVEKSPCLFVRLKGWGVALITLNTIEELLRMCGAESCWEGTWREWRVTQDGYLVSITDAERMFARRLEP